MKLLLMFAGILLMLSCGKNTGNFEISGEFENAAGKSLYLLEMNAFEINPFDSVTVDQKGKFHLSGNVEQPRFFILRDKPSNQVILLIQPGEKLSLTGDFNNLQKSYQVEGSEDSKLVRKLNNQMQNTIMRLDSLSNYYHENLTGFESETEIEDLRARVRLKFEEIADIQRDFTVDFITRNTSSLASLMALYQQIDPTSFVLNREEDLRYYVMVDSVLMKIYPGLDYTITLHENVSDLIDARAFRDIGGSSLGIGAVAPEIELPNPDGKVIKLSSLRGQYVLLDFWAAWCSPCRHENPYLVDAYEKFNSKGFTIYQVSLDRTKDAWVKGINDDKIGKWHHVSDLQFWNSSVVPVFQIEGIPASFLLDKEGRIIARNLRGEALGAKLAELMN